MEFGEEGGDNLVEKIYRFAVDKVERLNLDEYPDDEFAVVRLGFLSTAPNAHGLNINEKVLRRNAESALGRFVVAKIVFNDTRGHENDQNIFGYVPKEQEIEFTQEDEYLRASCLAVISKVYAEEFCDILERDGEKSISVEMKVTTPEDDEGNVLAFRVFGITVLGQRISPSCPNSTINFVRFSEDKANDFYNKIHKGAESKLHQFAQSRREQFMAETKKTYKVDKSKDAMSTKAWGDVDKAELRDKVVDASNRTSLIKDVYMLVEDGWEDAPSEHLKYPVMNFDGDTLVYNRDGLASALGYAKKENETAVVTKVEKIYKKLGLESEGEEEDKKMSKEVEFAAVNIGDLWDKIWVALYKRYPDGNWGSVYRIHSIYEEDNKKFAIIHKKDEEAKYRLDFSLTEDGLTLADEIVKVEIELVETDEIRQFSEPENVDKYTKFEGEVEGRKAWAKVIKKVQDHEGDGVYVDSIEDNHIIYTKDDVRYHVEANVKVDPDDKSVDAEIKWDTVKKDADQKMSSEEMEAKITEMKADIESRDNIIMEKDKELEELRLFKEDVENREKTISVEAIMADVKDCFDDVKFAELRDEGLASTIETLDAWSNKVKAIAFSATKKPANKKDFSGVWAIPAPVQNQKANKGLWD